MASTTRGFKKSYGLLIIGTMLLGVVAGAFYFYHPDCGSPGQPSGSFHYTTVINYQGQDLIFDAFNYTFTGTQQPFNFDNVTFTTLQFSDPSKPHVIGLNCGTDPSQPGTMIVGVTSSNNAFPGQTLQLQFNVNSDQGSFTSNTSPIAGVVWHVREPFFVLLVST